MKKLIIIAILAMFIVACAPALPAKDSDKTTSAKTITKDNADSKTATKQVKKPATAPNIPVKKVSKEAKSKKTTEPEVGGTQDVKASAPKTKKSDSPKKKVTEGELVSFPNLKAIDPDGDPITYTFTSPLNDEGEWKTSVGDAGEYKVTIAASDGTNTVSQEILIVVEALNKAPIITVAKEISAKEGTSFTLDVKVEDPDGQAVKVTFSGWMSGKTKKISYDEAGDKRVIIEATDGVATSKQEVIVKVQNVNRAPVLEAFAPIKVKEGELVELKAKTSDPDDNKVTVSFESPVGKDGTYQTKVGDAGSYEWAVVASDGNLTTTQKVKVIVEAVNKAPSISLASPISVDEGQTVLLEPVIKDLEGDKFTITYSGWMSSNSKKTDFKDAGNHKVTITAKDAKGNEAALDVIVAVKNVNRAPVFGDGAFT